MGKKKGSSSLEKQILKVLNNQSKPTLSLSEVSKLLGVDSEKQSKKLTKALRRLAQRDQIAYTHANSISLLKPKPGKTVEHRSLDKPSARPVLTGPLDVNRYGVGFVTVPGFEEDIRIPSKWMGTAMKGDIVEITLFPSRKGREEGKVTGIQKRRDGLMVGVVGFVGEDSAIIEPDEKSGSQDFWVSKQDLNKAQSGEKVVFKLKEWNNAKAMPQAYVVEILGDSGGNDAQILGILAEHQFITNFPREVEKEAESFSVKITPEILKNRLDLRDERIFTIDPADAKDFDDAIHIKILENGNYELGVHIADVTHYVHRNSPLDKEAFDRATSVYLVDRTIPMLPEHLSNGVCSLVPEEDRLTFSCIMEVTPRGKVAGFEIAETIIHSKKRFTYEEAQAVLEGEDHEFKADLLQANALAKILTKKRMRGGSIDFDNPEPKFRLDPEGVPLEVIIKERKDSNRLIEEFMLLANQTVAKSVEEIRKKSGKRSASKEWPFLYRNHDRPDESKLKAVQEQLAPMGIVFNKGEEPISSRNIQAVLDQVKGTNYEHIINSLTLRSLAKADYGPSNVGHFGLAFTHYAHFTSPIRRYPDVIVHRLLKAYNQSTKYYTYAELEAMGEHCSVREREAQNAERDSVKLKQVEFMSRKIGERFEGIITGVTEFGIYVETKPHLCEGMIRMSDLDDDFYRYDPQRHWLIGSKRGRKLKLGDPISVRILRTNTRQKTIDLAPDH